jgi:ribA/ribD-fused uncharacterized protein
MNIDRFIQEQQYLSLSFLQMSSPINYDGRLWISALHLFSALKTDNKILRDKIRQVNAPAEAEAMSREITLRPNWEGIKLDVMRMTLKLKFSNAKLRDRLIATGDAPLINGGTNGDTFWGVCDGKGENHLGKLLMMLRAKLQQGQEPWPAFNKCSVCESARRAGAKGHVGCSLWSKEAINFTERGNRTGNLPESEEALYKACVSPNVFDVMATGWVYLRQRPEHKDSSSDTGDSHIMTNGMVLVPQNFRCEKYQARLHY